MTACHILPWTGESQQLVPAGRIYRSQLRLSADKCHALLGHERAFSAIESSLRFHSGWTGYTELGNQCPLSRRPPTSTCGPLSADAREPPRTLAAPQRRQTTDSTQIPLARSLPRSSLCQPYLASLIVQIWLTPEYGWLSIRFQAAPSACGRDFPPRADSRGPHFVVESPAASQQKGISVEKQVLCNNTRSRSAV